MSEQTVETVAAPENREKRELSTCIAGYIDLGLDRLTALGQSERYDFCVRWASTLGHYAILAAAVIGFLGGLVFAIRAESGDMFWMGLGWLVALPLLQYTAVKFLSTTQSLVAGNETSVGSAAFLRCTALLALVAALAALIGGFATAIGDKSIYPLLGGIASAIVLVAVGWTALRPELLNISVRADAGAGEEALGVVSFFVKTVMKLIPVVFGAVLVVSTVQLLITVFRGMFAEGYGILGAYLQSLTLCTSIIGAILLPFAAYLVFLLYYLLVDVVRAVLSVPKKLEALDK